MRRLTDSTVVRHPQTGEAVLLAQGGPVPDWAADLVGDHLLSEPRPRQVEPAAEAPAETPADERARLLARLAELDQADEPGLDGSDGEDNPPPKSGPGSGAPRWREYAARRRVEVPADASREDVVAALDAAGVRTE
ncbi:hypothetical protein ACH4T9_31200 [Micromonospora sp. NPDC020750]|uniref:hypothetical protein n=1 Tax=unclassified Micromonospora TaxID=2617518 RepID=UPI0037A795E6